MVGSIFMTFLRGLEGTARHSCAHIEMGPLLSTALHGSGQPNNPQHSYGSTPTYGCLRLILSMLLLPNTDFFSLQNILSVYAIKALMLSSFHYS